jgi:serine/threonine-protein phosphatase 6 regulatory ankyrin repeat subunit B
LYNWNGSVFPLWDYLLISMFMLLIYIFLLLVLIVPVRRHMSNRDDMSNRDLLTEVLNARDDRGFTALICAIKQCRYDLASALIAAGADVKARGSDGTTALIACVNFDIRIAERRIEIGRDVEAQTRRVNDEIKMIASQLLERGANKYTRASDGSTLLMHACTRGHAGLVEVLLVRSELEDGILLRRWVDWVHAVDDFGDTALHMAVANGNVDCIKVLIGAGFDVNCKDSYGLTALHTCTGVEMTRLLLELGADPRRVDCSGKTVLMTPGSVARLRLLLETAPDLVGVKDDSGQGIVAYLSSFNEGYEALRELFRFCEVHGVDVGTNNKDDDGETALYTAMWRLNLPTVKLLLEKGVDVMSHNNRGVTVLMHPFLVEERFREMFAYQPLHECLKAVIDAAVLRSSGGVVGAAADAEAQEETVAKRGRVGNK